MGKNDLLLIKGARFWGTHGAYPEENELGQEFIVDARINVDMEKQCRSDRLEDGYSYVTAYNIIKKVVTEEEHNLLQKLAQRIAEELFASHPLNQVEITVKKPAVAIGGIVEYTAVTIVRDKGDIKYDL